MAHDGNGKTLGDTPIDSKELLALYDEAKEMLNEAAQYFGGAGSPRNLDLHADNTLAYTEGSKCITARLMEIMTWLFVQRAVATGEMTADEALKDNNRLGTVAAPRADPQDVKYGLPETLRDLDRRSGDLFDRIQRTDQLMNSPTTGIAH